MDRLKAFFIGTLKVAIAMFLVAIAIIAVIWGWNTISENRQKAQEAPLAEPKNWPPKTIDALESVKVELMTMWRGGELYYKFSVDGYPKALEAARNQSDSKFTISFLDRNGFKVFGYDVELNGMSRVSSAPGQVLGLRLNTKTHMAAEDYRNAAGWTIGWNFPTTVESPRVVPKQDAPVAKPDAPKWRNKALWRQLNREMSKDKVQQLLGPPTKIDNSGVLIFWYYGYPLGGEVVFDSGGGIYSWREP
jgi:hypothetical protein